MWGSATVYSGVIIGVAGLGLVVMQWRRAATRRRGVVVAATGVFLASVGLFLPVSETRVNRPETRLDEFAPVWQFREIHSIRVAATPDRVFDAIRRVRADEILLFRTLTWIRRGGRPLPPSILNAGTHEPLIDVATHAGFVKLADAAPRELVIGTVVVAPPGTRGTLTPQVFQKPLPPGFALATMNFLVTADRTDGSVVKTETRVYANSPSVRRRFAAYWRVIYPGSAIIRRMWLRAIERRAIGPESNVSEHKIWNPSAGSDVARLEAINDVGYHAARARHFLYGAKYPFLARGRRSFRPILISTFRHAPSVFGFVE